MKFHILGWLLLVVVSCAPQATPGPDTPATSPPEDSIVPNEPIPSPCNQLRAKIGTPDVENKIEVELYSVSDPNQVCAQVLKPFEESIDLGTFPSGHYTVWINGEIVGEFDA